MAYDLNLDLSLDSFPVVGDSGLQLIDAAVLAFDPAPWTEGVGWTSNGDGTATYTAGSGTTDYTAFGALELDETYTVRFTVSGLTSGSISFRFGDIATPDATISADGDYEYTLTATGGTGIRFRAVTVTGTDVTLSNFVVGK